MVRQEGGELWDEEVYSRNRGQLVGRLMRIEIVRQGDRESI